MIKRISLAILIAVLSTGCAALGSSNQPPPETQSFLAPPMPQKSTCTQGRIESVVISATGGTKVWYYSGSSFLSVDFRPGVNVRIIRATENDFCYDYF